MGGCAEQDLAPNLYVSLNSHFTANFNSTFNFNFNANANFNFNFNFINFNFINFNVNTNFNNFNFINFNFNTNFNVDSVTDRAIGLPAHVDGSQRLGSRAFNFCAKRAQNGFGTGPTIAVPNRLSEGERLAVRAAAIGPTA